MKQNISTIAAALEVSDWLCGSVLRVYMRILHLFAASQQHGMYRLKDFKRSENRACPASLLVAQMTGAYLTEENI